MSSAQTQPSSGSDVGPEDPDQQPGIDSGSSVEESQEDEMSVIDSYDIETVKNEEDYQVEALHISDTEYDNPYEDVLDEYGDDIQKIDVVVDTGDVYKLPIEVRQFDEDYDGEFQSQDFDDQTVEDYIQGLEDGFSGISQVAEESGSTALSTAGNHDPVYGSHPSEDADAFKNAVEERAKEKFDDYDGETNLRQYFLDKYDIKDIEEDFVEINGVRIVGGPHGVGPEVDEEYLEDPELDDFYSEEELKEIFDLEEVEEPEDIEEIEEEAGSGGGYLSGVYKMLSNGYKAVKNMVSGLLSPIKSLLGGSGENEVTLEDINLEDIPEEEMNKEHREHMEKRDEAMEKYNEVKESVEPMLDYDGPVMLAAHQDFDVESEYGSKVYSDLAEDIDVMLGGHTHGNTVYEYEGAVNVNSAETFSRVGVGENVHVDQYEYENISEEDVRHAAQEVKDLTGTGMEQAIQMVQEAVADGLHPKEVPQVLKQNMETEQSQPQSPPSSGEQDRGQQQAPA